MTRAVADILRAAKARIGTPERWCQGGASWEGLKGEQYPACAAIACWWHRGPRGAASDDERAAINALEAVVMDHLPTWNDAPERTHAEVMAAFDRAIAAEEAS